MRTRPSHVYKRPLTSLILYTDDESTRYEILAVSANGATALMQVHKFDSGRWHKTSSLATCPIDRIHAHSDFIEPGPWLAVFPALPFTVVSLTAPLAAMVC